jgi:hypothetical protein
MFNSEEEKQWQNLDKAVSEEILDREKCIKQLVLNVGRNAKFLSSLLKASQFTAKNAIKKRKDSSFISIFLEKENFLFFIFFI